MERWKTIFLPSRKGPPEQKSGPISLGSWRAVATFLLIMGTAALLVLGISRLLR
jgi:hypothetical protein